MSITSRASVSLRSLTAGPIAREEKHYYIIDLLRGLAACAILFWHYQHFITLGMAEPGSRSGYPFYRLFALLYEHGGSAVQLFWIISGFVFSAVYVGSGISARRFFEHRIARLYPLHLVTLLVVAALQMLCVVQFGRGLIYPENDAGNFGLQLIMGTGWGIGGSHSFNGPIWSVSAEVFIYAVFWASLRHLFRWRLAIPLAASGALFALGPWSPIALCGAYFFLGCAVYAFHRTQSRRLEITAGIAAIAAFALLLHLGLQGMAVLFLFCGLLALCAALEDGPFSKLAASVPWIADNTYGVYLWHIPVQLTVLVTLAKLGISREIAYSGWFFVAYLAAVTLIARVSFVWFERPMRGMLRNLGKSRLPRPSSPDKEASGDRLTTVSHH